MFIKKLIKTHNTECPGFVFGEKCPAYKPSNGRCCLPYKASDVCC
ncbi:hypothetical protein [Acidaminobacter sp. JC074]|nr:hypothetical protein [Acidaminobacter sp. JC074]